MTGNGTFAFRGHVDASVLRSDIRLLSSIPWNESTRQPRFASALTSGVGNAAWRRAILDNLPTRHSRTGAAPNDARDKCNVVRFSDTTQQAATRIPAHRACGTRRQLLTRRGIPSFGLHRKRGRAKGFGVVRREPPQAISQDRHVEIDEQADGHPRKSQIRDYLRLVNREQTLDRFEFEQNAA